MRQLHLGAEQPQNEDEEKERVDRSGADYRGQVSTGGSSATGSRGGRRPARQRHVLPATPSIPPLLESERHRGLAIRGASGTRSPDGQIMNAELSNASTDQSLLDRNCGIPLSLPPWRELASLS